MEGRLWGIVCMVVPRCKARLGQQYSDREILLVMLWAVLPGGVFGRSCFLCPAAQGKLAQTFGK